MIISNVKHYPITQVLSYKNAITKQGCSSLCALFEPRQEKNRIFTSAKLMAQITAQLISIFVFAAHIVQFIFFLNHKVQASSLLLRLYRPVCVRPGRKHKLLVF